MPAPTTRRATAAALLAAALLAAGCADRRIHITSDPPGALVTLNDVQVGRTPVEVNFTSFGVYDVQLRREGYASLTTNAEARPELHDQPLFDAASVIQPGRPRTDVYWHFVMEPLETDPDALIQRAREIRDRAPGPAADETSAGAAEGPAGEAGG